MGIINDYWKSNADKIYAKVGWTIEDVRSTRAGRGYTKWSDEDINLWLRQNEGRIEDAMVERGWDAIDDLIYDGKVN